MSDTPRLATLIVVIASIAIALLLSIIPLPSWIIWLQPQWVALVVIFWAMNLPYRFGVGFAWITGLLLDIVYGSVLGEHALALVIIAYIVNKSHGRLQNASNWNRTLAVFLLIVLYQLILFLILGILGSMPLTWRYWITPLTSAIFWPWIYYILRSYQYRYRIMDESSRRFGYSRDL